VAVQRPIISQTQINRTEKRKRRPVGPTFSGGEKDPKGGEKLVDLSEFELHHQKILLVLIGESKKTGPKFIHLHSCAGFPHF
jgi:hypothetical protein